MRVSWATEAVPGRDWLNEDFVAAAEGAVVVLDGQGPGELIRRTRETEYGDPDCRRWPRHKRHDDATAALCVF